MARVAGDHGRECMLCGKACPVQSCARADAVRGTLVDHIQQHRPGVWRADGRICQPCLQAARASYVVEQLERDRGELGEIEVELSRKVAEHVAVASHIEKQFERELTLGQRLADRVATVGGSWPFVAGFGCCLALWVAINSLALGRAAFDPYPYIFLNLVLSCLAAIQAPVIMMSQNRSAARDRLEADEDYKINLKAELEIAALHEKIDHLLHVQWGRMVEIQQTQLELLNELVAGHRR